MRDNGFYRVLGIQHVAVEKAHIVADELGGEAVDLQNVVLRLVSYCAGDIDGLIVRGDDDLG